MFSDVEPAIKQSDLLNQVIGPVCIHIRRVSGGGGGGVIQQDKRIKKTN